jgi:hypothetical protein
MAGAFGVKRAGRCGERDRNTVKGPSTTPAKAHHVLDDGFTVLENGLLLASLVGTAFTHALFLTIDLDGH